MRTWSSRTVFLIAVSMAMPTVAFGSPSAADAVAAQRHFDEGLSLKDRGRYAEACTEFAESQRLDPGIGTQYQLADCYLKAGRTATAQALFEDVAKQAGLSGQRERERIARERALEIARSVPRLTIAVPVSSDAPALEIRRDGTPLVRDKWNIALPVDPGTHEIVARLGSASWRSSVTLRAFGQTETVIVPTLVPSPAPPTTAAVEGAEGAPAPGSFDAATTVQPERREGGIGKVTAGLVLGGLGLAGIATGVVFTVRSVDRRARAEDLGCASGTCPTQSGVDARSSAVVAGNLATAAYALGAAATVGGLYLILVARRETKAPSLSADFGLGRFELRGAF